MFLNRMTTTIARRTALDSTVVQPTAEQPSGGLTIFDFPRGAKAGTCLHEIFELLDYDRLNSAAITAAVRASLPGNGFR